MLTLDPGAGMSSPFNLHSLTPTPAEDNVTKASVLIVNWNAKAFLLQCLESVSQQLQRPFAEIIVVDNASTDDSVAAVRHAFPKVEVIENNNNLGFARANNLAMRTARGTYFFLINSDVTLRPKCISTLCAYLDDHPEVGILGPTILNADLTLQQSFRPTPTLGGTFCRALALDTIAPVRWLIERGIHRKQIGPGREVDILSGCFWVVRREALPDVGMLDEEFFMYGEDKDWCVRFWKAGWRVAYLPEAQAVHFGGASSAREPLRFYVEMHRSNLRYWKKHRGWLSQKCVTVVMLLHQLVRIIAGAGIYLFVPSRRHAIHYTMQRCFVCFRQLLAWTCNYDQL